MISSLRSGTICYHFTTLSFCFHFSIQSLPSISTTTTRAPAIHPLPGPLYRCLHEPPGFCSVPLMIHFLHSSEWDPLKLQIWCAWHPNKVRLLSAHLTTFPLTLPLTSWVLLSLIRPKLLKKNHIILCNSLHHCPACVHFLPFTIVGRIHCLSP